MIFTQGKLLTDWRVWVVDAWCMMFHYTPHIHNRWQLENYHHFSFPLSKLGCIINGWRWKKIHDYDDEDEDHDINDKSCHEIEWYDNETFSWIIIDACILEALFVPYFGGEGWELRQDIFVLCFTSLGHASFQQYSLILLLLFLKINLLSFLYL